MSSLKTSNKAFKTDWQKRRFALVLPPLLVALCLPGNKDVIVESK
jgi:hypothetical protein